VYIYLKYDIYNTQKEKKREMKDLSETRRNLKSSIVQSFENLDESVHVIIYFTVLHIYMLRS